jgi:hypothetical protein
MTDEYHFSGGRCRLTSASRRTSCAGYCMEYHGQREPLKRKDVRRTGGYLTEPEQHDVCGPLVPVVSECFRGHSRLRMRPILRHALIIALQLLALVYILIALCFWTELCGDRAHDLPDWLFVALLWVSATGLVGFAVLVFSALWCGRHVQSRLLTMGIVGLDWVAACLALFSGCCGVTFLSWGR